MRCLFFLLEYNMQINDVEKGYYADGEDAYDMRLPFPRSETSSGIKPMTPLKQVVAVNAAAAAAAKKPKEQAPKASAGEAVQRAGETSEGASTGGDAAKGAEGSSADEVANKLEGLSVDADKDKA